MWKKGPGACRGEMGAYKSAAAPTVPQIRPGCEAPALLPGAGVALSTGDTSYVGGTLILLANCSAVPEILDVSWPFPTMGRRVS
jgi:hypothetical protein